MPRRNEETIDTEKDVEQQKEENEEEEKKCDTDVQIILGSMVIGLVMQIIGLVFIIQGYTRIIVVNASETSEVAK